MIKSMIYDVNNKKVHKQYGSVIRAVKQNTWLKLNAYCSL